MEYERVYEIQFTQPSTVHLGSCVGRRQASPPLQTLIGQHELTNFVSAFPRLESKILHRAGPTSAPELLHTPSTVTYALKISTR
jgi:hypothetical protein